MYIVIIKCLTPSAQLQSFDWRGVPCTLLWGWWWHCYNRVSYPLCSAPQLWFKGGAMYVVIIECLTPSATQLWLKGGAMYVVMGGCHVDCYGGCCVHCYGGVVYIVMEGVGYINCYGGYCVYCYGGCCGCHVLCYGGRGGVSCTLL